MVDFNTIKIPKIMMDQAYSSAQAHYQLGKIQNFATAYGLGPTKSCPVCKALYFDLQKHCHIKNDIEHTMLSIHDS